MKNNISLNLVGIALTLAALAPQSVSAFAVPSGRGGDIVLNENLINQFKAYDGKKISSLHFNGLVRTREIAVRWLMSSLEGTTFSSLKLAQNVQRLANTGNVYDITPVVTPNPRSPDEIDLVIALNDKWTLLPAFGAQGGGGSLTVGGGLIESNLLGFMVNSSIFIYSYNGILSYDVNLNQEYIAASPVMAYIDWSNNVNPTIIHNIDGSAAGNFTWERQQEEVMLGTHWDGPIRLMGIADLYYDSLNLDNAVNASVYSGTQYRLQPKIIFGRSDIIEYLERGYELTLHPSSSNFFGPVQAYQGFDASFKKVFLLNDKRSNFAYFIFGGLMSKAPPPYEYQVGGYYNLRGFIDSRQVGPYTAYANIEYRPFLFTFHFRWPDIDYVAFQGCLFTDYGSAWGDSTLTGDSGANQFNPLWSAGLGLRANFVHFAGAIVRLDVARTLRPDEGLGLSFGVGQFF